MALQKIKTRPGTSTNSICVKISVVDPESSISSEARFGSRVLMTKSEKNIAEIFSFLFFEQKFLGLHKGRTSHMRSLQPSKDNIKHFKR
jgi:hypothetical protein